MSKLLQSPAFYRIVRNPNVFHNGDVSLYDRTNTLDNNIRVLEDPENNRKLTLIGTMNTSDLLASRTQKLLENQEFSSLLVQTTPEWYSHISQSKTNIKVILILESF